MVRELLTFDQGVDRLRGRGEVLRRPGHVQEPVVAALLESLRDALDERSSCSDVSVSVKGSRSRSASCVRAMLVLRQARPLSGSREDESASLTPIYFES